MTDQFDAKKHISIFFTAKTCPLKHTDLLVYCYRCHQDSFQTLPSCRRTAKATGIKEETVACASERLRQYGLLRTDYSVINPCPRMDWFQESEVLSEKFIERHFSMWFRNWRCYIRQPGYENPLTVASVMIYSLIRHSLLNKWKPPEGWSHQYLSSITHLSDKTVGSSLEQLERLGFLTVLEGLRFKLYRLRNSQLHCFADKKPYSGTSSCEPDVLVDEFSPAGHILDEKEKARRQLVEYLDRFPIANRHKNRIYRSVTQMDIFPKDWRKVAEKCVDVVFP